jgi:hypothetical protein
MTSKSTFEHRLHDLIEDGPTTAPAQLLETVVSTVPSIPQRRGAWRAPWRTNPMLGFARALAGVAIAVAVGSAVLFLLVLRPAGDVGSSPSPSAPIAALPSPSASPSPSATASPSPTPTPSATPKATPKPTVAPTTGACDPAKLAARITMWEGAAGSRIAQIEMTNMGSSPCTVRAMERPQLVDGQGKVLINGAAPGASATLTMAPGGVLKTEIEDSNYCGAAPKAPVTVAFVLNDGRKIVAAPLSPTDVTVPPCNGAGQPAQISMKPWAP